MNIPKDLKIHPPKWPNIADLLREVADLSEDSIRQGDALRARTVEVLPENVSRALIALAMNAWRIQVKLTDSDQEPRENVGNDEIKKINRYCQAMFESLRSIGMEVKDRTGEAFDYGLPEKVVSTQPKPGLTKEVIIETIRPTIYWNTQIAQPGEVVIATPEISDTKDL
jgi:hypothetical protein